MIASGNCVVESDIDNWPVAIDTTETFADVYVSLHLD